MTGTNIQAHFGKSIRHYQLTHKVSPPAEIGLWKKPREKRHTQHIEAPPSWNTTILKNGSGFEDENSDVQRFDIV